MLKCISTERMQEESMAMSHSMVVISWPGQDSFIYTCWFCFFFISMLFRLFLSVLSRAGIFIRVSGRRCKKTKTETYLLAHRFVFRLFGVIIWHGGSVLVGLMFLIYWMKLEWRSPYKSSHKHIYYLLRWPLNGEAFRIL